MTGCMKQPLDEIFGELGISQYLDAFIDQGFDSWETILDITESDLDALGVKLGHRRKLQRRIANFRGVAPDAALVSPARPSIEDPRLDTHRPDAPVKVPEARDVPAAAAITKRKYRRHPKPDENAPERPPSAYVLFSNKMRDDLKGRNLTFTEIAKLVGENWQNLSQAEKEPFETQAQVAKEKYNQDLTEYKKTPDYKKYTVYLQEFKAKHAEKDASKRVKLSEATGAALRAGMIPGANEVLPPAREQRVGSTVSMADSMYSASETPHSRQASVDEPLTAPQPHPSERSPTFSASPRAMPPRQPSRRSTWDEVHRAEPSGTHRHLPSFSDIFDSRVSQSHDLNGASPLSHQNSNGSPGPPPGLIGGLSRPPSLRKEYSSAGSVSSGGSHSYPRTPIDGSLPIHTLLQGKPGLPYDSAQTLYGQTSLPTNESKYPFPHIRQDGTPSDVSSSASSNLNPTGAGYFPPPPPSTNHTPGIPPLSSEDHRMGPRPSLNGGKEGPPNLDGMSALLRAGELVDRRPR